MITSVNDFKRGFLCACQFLTRLPVPEIADYQPQDSGHALPLFPLVGLLIGVTLTLIGFFLGPHLSSNTLAALLVLVWIAITGALHLDGLGDSADGWLSGATGTKALQIMKDPHCGSGAVAAVVVIVLMKYALLTEVLASQNLLYLIVVPMIGRVCALILLLTTPYVSDQGIARDFLQYSSRKQLWISTGLTALFSLCMLPIGTWVMMVLITTGLIASLRQLMLKRLEGTNGDTCGALIEIAEVCALLAMSLH